MLWASQIHVLEATNLYERSANLDLRAQMLALMYHDVLPGGSITMM